MKHLTWYESVGKNYHTEVPTAIIGSSDSSIHIVGSLISHHNELMTDGQSFVMRAQEIVTRNNAVVVGHHISQFTSTEHDQSGYSAAVVLAESHITIHTWPELNMVELDVYLCNVLQNNRAKCRTIFKELVDEFNAIKTTFVEVPRPNLSAVESSTTTTTSIESVL